MYNGLAGVVVSRTRGLERVVFVGRDPFYDSSRTRGLGEAKPKQRFAVRPRCKEQRAGSDVRRFMDEYSSLEKEFTTTKLSK